MAMEEESTKLTPMLQQYYELKKQVGDAILFFRMGDFYELFGDDATLAAPILDIVLTSREKGAKERIPFCGVPHHSARSYWMKLLKRGMRVGIAEQLGDPQQAKGLVQRAVTRVLTPGSMDELEDLEGDAPNYLMGIFENPASGGWAIAVADVSTGELRLGSVPSQREVFATLEQMRPRELLVRRFQLSWIQEALPTLDLQPLPVVSVLPEGPIHDERERRRILREILGSEEIRHQPCGVVGGGDELIASILQYFAEIFCSTKTFRTVKALREPETMILDEAVIRDLEIFESSLRRQREGSLWQVLNHTLTGMGARHLRYQLANPTTSRQVLATRHSLVGALVKLGQDHVARLRDTLQNIPDLERLAGRLMSLKASPLEMARVRRGLRLASELSDILAPLTQNNREISGLGSLLRTGTSIAETVDLWLLDTPGMLGSGNGVFREGVDDTLDRANRLARSGEQAIAEYEEKLRQETGISSLKVKEHKSYGLLIEVTRANATRVPSEWTRRQTMTNGERFSTPALAELNTALASAWDQAVARELELFGSLAEKMANSAAAVADIARALGSLDFFQSLSWLALTQDYCQPQVSSQETLHLVACRHPVVESVVGRHQFTANDIHLHRQQSHMLITGPNMAGKSTVMRQTAICAILHQIGSYLPAVKAEMPIFDRIFTRIGSGDDLARGRSTFMVEMAETSEILRCATANSLVILDEVGRGTSTEDGLAIATAIIEDLAKRVRSFSLFATHYHELVAVAEPLGSFQIMQTEVCEEGAQISFTHRLVPGASGNSFGIEVAKLAGIPESVILRAKETLAERRRLQNVGDTGEPSEVAPISHPIPTALGRTAAPRILDDGPLPESPQAPASAPNHPLLGIPEQRWSQVQSVCERLERVTIHRTTPLQALNILNDLCSMLFAANQGDLFPPER